MPSSKDTKQRSPIAILLLYFFAILFLIGGIAIYLIGIKSFIDNGIFGTPETLHNPPELRFRESPFSILFVLGECISILFALLYRRKKSEPRRIWPIVVLATLLIFLGESNVSFAVTLVSDPLGVLGYAVSAIVIIVVAVAISWFSGSPNNSSSSCNGEPMPHADSKLSSKTSQRKLTYGLSNPNFRKTRGKSFGMEVEGVFCTGAQGQEIYVCSVEDFEKGKVAVMNNGTRITRVAGCKAPER